MKIFSRLSSLAPGYYSQLSKKNFCIFFFLIIYKLYIVKLVLTNKIVVVVDGISNQVDDDVSNGQSDDDSEDSISYYVDEDVSNGYSDDSDDAISDCGDDDVSNGYSDELELELHLTTEFYQLTIGFHKSCVNILQ